MHNYCDSCIELGISEIEQKCFNCSENYIYDYFYYLEKIIFLCIPEGYLYNYETRLIKKCESTQYKFFYLSNRKRICFK